MDQSLENQLRQSGVSERIIERVMRFPQREGEALRGIHCKRFERPWSDVIGRGEAIKRFGREKADAAQKIGCIKRGRRVWISYLGLVQVGAV